MTDLRLVVLLLVALGCGSCQGDCPSRSAPGGRYIITEAEDERLLYRTAEVERGTVVVEYEDDLGATYRVTLSN